MGMQKELKMLQELKDYKDQHLLLYLLNLPHQYYSPADEMKSELIYCIYKSKNILLYFSKVFLVMEGR